MNPPVIIGAGPAGLAAAAAFVKAGVRPVILEETPNPGGQGTRRLSPLIAPYAARIFGNRHARETDHRERFEDEVLSSCDWRPGSLVWAIYDKNLYILRDGRHETLPYDQLLIATGATDRIMPFPGWTLPGIFSLGGAQTALKRHSAFIGQTIVLAGASPLLYLVAAQYRRMGARNLTVIDETPMRARTRAAPGMLLTAPGTLTEGLGLIFELRRAGLRVIHGARLRRAIGAERLEAIEIISANGEIQTLPCDALGFGHGLRPETQLAELAGASFRFDSALRNWFPVIDADGRACDDLWVAGECAVTGGRIAAARSGQLAALAMLSERTKSPGTEKAMQALRRQTARLRKFQQHMAYAFRWPHEQVADLPDSTIICRCERITAGTIRAAIRKPAGPVEVNRVKAMTRCGMGRCQGRFCGAALHELTAVTANLPIEAVGRLRAQAPFRPIPISSATEPASS